MSVYSNKEREEKRKAKLKQEQEVKLKQIERVEPKAKTKSIYDLKTFDELLEYYYVIPKCVIFDEDVQKAIKIACIKSREKTNINLVRRGKKNKKLTKKQEQEIRNSNLSNAKLSKIYNVSTTTIFRVKHSQE